MSWFKQGDAITIRKDSKAILRTILIFGILGLIASFVLSVEEFHLIKNPDAELSCSFNLVLNCATVMQTWQASVFGFPNMFIGLMAYPVVITFAVLLLNGTTTRRWVLIAANICFGLGLAFAYWLFFNSVYDIEVLCPWCLVVTFVTTILFEAVTRLNLRHNTYKFSKSKNETVQRFLDRDFDKLATATWITFLALLVFLKFGADLFA